MACSILKAMSEVECTILVQKCIYFCFGHACQSTSVSFKFFKMANRVDVVNAIGKSVKKE